MNPECDFEPTNNASTVREMIPNNSSLPVYIAIANEGAVHAVPVQQACILDDKLYIGTLLTIKAILRNAKVEEDA